MNFKCHPISVILLIALLISIGFNWIFFTYGRLYYLALNETRLDPLGLSYYPSDTTQQNPPCADKATVVFFGDSRAADWPSPSNLTRFEFINRGIGGQTSAQTLHRFNHHVKPLNPQVIILQVGINDLKIVPLFPERKETIVATCKQNIQHILAQSTDAGATVILTTIFPVGEIPVERRPFWSPDVDKAVDEVDVCRRTAPQYQRIPATQ